MAAAMIPDNKDFWNTAIPCMWTEVLKKVKNAQWIAPVSFFAHAPFSKNWDDLAKYQGFYIELPNGSYYMEDNRKMEIYWLGQIKGFVGYKALVFYHPVAPNNPTETKPTPFSTWIAMCSRVPKPLGSAFLSGGLLQPPRTMLNPSPDNPGPLVDAAFQKLLFPAEGTPAQSLPFTHEADLLKELARCSARFKPGDIVEVIDKDKSGQYKIGEIVHQIGVGDRVYCQYIPGEDSTSEKNGIWISQHSQHVNKLGWCDAVGAPLDKNVNFSKVYFPKLKSTEDLNIPATPVGIRIQDGMIFEMRHPTIPSKMCVGYVIKVLRHGYILAGVDFIGKKTCLKKVLHITSDYIQPVGFCQTNKIEIEYPANPGVMTFEWSSYLARYRIQPLKITPSGQKRANPFTRGCKLEAVMLTDSSSICFRPATVVKVAGRLMQIHFDQFSRQDKEAYQWISCDSCNIYPAGYAEMVGCGQKGKANLPRIWDSLVIGGTSVKSTQESEELE